MKHGEAEYDLLEMYNRKQPGPASGHCTEGQRLVFMVSYNNVITTDTA